MDRPLKTEELEISAPIELSDLTSPFEAVGATTTAALSARPVPSIETLPASDGARLGVDFAVGGKILSGIGDHAVRAGTSSNPARVTSQTK